MRMVLLQQEVSPRIGCAGSWPFSHPVHHFTAVSMWDTVHSSIVLSLNLYLAAGRGLEAGAAMQMFSSAKLKMFCNPCLLHLERREFIDSRRREKTNPWSSEPMRRIGVDLLRRREKYFPTHMWEVRGYHSLGKVKDTTDTGLLQLPFMCS